ncbi:hypothetical protein CERZMDRAFT_36285 [Cercospora zeae-maydis SCOH1-5]|uniref:M protein repeat protein n=1 Tax=Cercospora zeae-maydis SCOH1-5 TaxID=717836 RepID=A0A6A6FNX9_9PEZI|nr:hypothetical protein CERZMDRAFT_36285 [Cercospora zeae-maydis SCOH1-5]
MADEDKEKAEKLAAAKKRFEQLKKKQAKEGKKGGKKKADKDKYAENKTEDAGDEAAAADAAANVEDAEADAQEEEEIREEVKGMERTKSFKEEASAAQSEVQGLYKKQTAKIEELEKENKSLKEQQEENTKKLSKAEEELQSLREGSGEVAELRSKAKETERLTTELATVQRQLTQAQKEQKSNTRRASSSASPELLEQLATKDSTIQSLELDISNLRNQITTLDSKISERDAAAKDLEERAKVAEAQTETVKQELDALRVSISFPSDETASAKDDPEALTKRISVLESDLRTANNNLEAAAKRATSLEQKIEALTKLHKDANATSQAKDRELADLRSQLQRQNQRSSHVRPDNLDDFELSESETETGQLQTRIRALEAENFDLRRGVWRDKRAELQPGMNDDGLEDVDLYTPDGTNRQRGSLPRQTSTFQDVINSGINAFTGRERNQPPRNRAESLGLMSDDGGFDEEAFRLAQEEEQKRRLERIKEVKRGLDQWKGWRVDLADLRRNGTGDGRQVGPVFEL